MILTEEQKHYVRIHYHNNPDPLNLAQGVFENPSLSPLSPQVKVVRGFIGHEFGNPFREDSASNPSLPAIPPLGLKDPRRWRDFPEDDSLLTSLSESVRESLDDLLRDGSLHTEQLHVAKKLHSIRQKGNQAAGLFSPMLSGKTETAAAFATMYPDDQWIYTPLVRDKDFFEDNERYLSKIPNVRCFPINKIKDNFEDLLRHFPHISGIFFDEGHYGAQKDSVMSQVITMLEKEFPKIFFLFISATPIPALLARNDLDAKFGGLPIEQATLSPSYSGISHFLEDDRVEIDHQNHISFLTPNLDFNGQTLLKYPTSNNLHCEWNPSQKVKEHVKHLLTFSCGVAIWAIRSADKSVSPKPTHVADLLKQVVDREWATEVEKGELVCFSVHSSRHQCPDLRDQFNLASGSQLKDKINHALPLGRKKRVILIIADTLKAGKNLGPYKGLVRSIIDPYKNLIAVVQALPGRLCGYGRKFWRIKITCNENALKFYDLLSKNPHCLNGKDIAHLLEEDGTTPISTGVVANLMAENNSIQEYHWAELPSPSAHFTEKGNWIVRYGEISGNNDYMRNTDFVKEHQKIYNPDREQVFCSPEHIVGLRRDIADGILNNKTHGGEIRYRATWDPTFPEELSCQFVEDILRKHGKKSDWAEGELEEIAAQTYNSITLLNEHMGNPDGDFVTSVFESLDNGPFPSSVKSRRDVIDLHWQGRLAHVAVSRPRTEEDGPSIRDGTITVKPDNIYNSK